MEMYSSKTRRRALITASAAVASLGGCLNSLTTSNQSINKEAVRLKIKPGNADGPDTVREWIEVKNKSDEKFNLENYKLKYNGGELYEFGELQLRPDGRVRVITTGKENYALKTRPPIYIRGAGLDSLLLSDNTTRVWFVDPEGNTIAEKEYKK